jgi:hypothetical protein
MLRETDTPAAVMVRADAAMYRRKQKAIWYVA